MTPEAKRALSSTIRGLRQRLLKDLRLMEEPGPSGQPLRKPALIKGGWGSTAYQGFRDLARGVVRDEPTEGFGFLLQLVCEELVGDLPGLFGSAGIGDLIPIPPATLRHAVEERRIAWRAKRAAGEAQPDLFKGAPWSPPPFPNQPAPLWPLSLIARLCWLGRLRMPAC